MKYDLEKRTTEFSKTVLVFLKSVQSTHLNKNIIEQLLRSSTSVGANYMEANGASSKKDFRYKIHICKKEIKETMYWIELLNELLEVKQKEKLKQIWQESKELTLIFNKIAFSLKH